MNVVIALPLHETTQEHKPTRLRLTRRGRIVFCAIAALLVIGVLSLAAPFAAPSAIASAEESNVAFGYVTVQPGATLWSIAAQLDPFADPRDVIADLVRLNQLESSSVWAGTVLAVPLDYSDAPGVLLTSQERTE